MCNLIFFYIKINNYLEFTKKMLNFSIYFHFFILFLQFISHEIVIYQWVDSQKTLIYFTFDLVMFKNLKITSFEIFSIVYTCTMHIHTKLYPMVHNIIMQVIRYSDPKLIHNIIIKYHYSPLPQYATRTRTNSSQYRIIELSVFCLYSHNNIN